MNKAILVDFHYVGCQAELFEYETQAFANANMPFDYATCKTEDEIIEGAQGYDYILCCGNPPITRRVIEALPDIKAILRYGIGVNSVDLEAATEHGKVVFFMPGFCFEELVMVASSMILALQRNLKYFDTNVCAGKWPKGTGRKPRRLSNLTIGLYGFGASAQPLAQVFNAGYGSRVIAYDPYINSARATELNVEPVSFDELVAQSDVISIHAPLTPETKHAFNKDVFRKMKKDSFIINTSRGGLVCEKDLIAALLNGDIAGAGMDVFETEPIAKDSPLLKMDNVILTPHTSFYGVESLETQHRWAADLVIQMAQGRIQMKNVANKKVLDTIDNYLILA